MKKVIALLGTLLLLGTAFYAVAQSGRESTLLPPQEIKLMYSSEQYFLKGINRSGVSKFMLMPDGAFAIYNSSGITQFEVLPDGAIAAYDKSGNTTWGIRSDSGVGVTGSVVATISGNTGTVSWRAASSGTSDTPAVPTGQSGWYLTQLDMLKYRTFMVEMSWPYTLKADGGATVYSDKCPVGYGYAGATMYLPTLTSSMNNMEWDFINTEGTTAFVLYDIRGRFRFGAATGSTPFSGLAGLASGTTSIPDGIGDSIKIRAIYYPATVSGWYVTGKSILEE